MRFAVTSLIAGVPTIIEIIEPRGPIEDLYSLEFVAALIDISATPEVTVGWVHDGGAFAPPVGPAAPTIEDRKASLRSAIDVEAERQRLRWITPGAGQAMTYARKVEEARRSAGEADPNPQDYPMLSASIGIDGDDLAQVAATIIAMDTAWGQIGAAIERRRLSLKREVDLAVGPEEIDTIEVLSGWPD